MTKRLNFGLVKAIINDHSKQVQLSFIPSKPGGLGPQAKQYCVDWALRSLDDLQAQGYRIDKSAIDSHLVE